MANGRCRMHGGPSTGPRTPEGLERSRRSNINWKHGHYSAEAKQVRRDARQQYRLLRQLIAESFLVLPLAAQAAPRSTRPCP